MNLIPLRMYPAVRSCFPYNLLNFSDSEVNSQKQSHEHVQAVWRASWKNNCCDCAASEVWMNSIWRCSLSKNGTTNTESSNEMELGHRSGRARTC